MRRMSIAAFLALGSCASGARLYEIGVVRDGAFEEFIRPLLEKNDIACVEGSSGLGCLDLFTTSGEDAARARALLERDAKLNGYAAPQPRIPPRTPSPDPRGPR